LDLIESTEECFFDYQPSTPKQKKPIIKKKNVVPRKQASRRKAAVLARQQLSLMPYFIP
jgi:hypothetical protein